MKHLMNLIRDERGIQHAEEALLLALIAIAAIGAAQALAGGVNNTFNSAAGTMNGAATP